MEILSFVRAQWDRTGAVVVAVAGLVAILFGWIGVSTNGYIAEQLPYIASGGLLGLFLLGVGGVLWISADLRDDWRETRLLRLELRESLGELSSGRTPVTNRQPSRDVRADVERLRVDV
jgi:hypothetical protein